jgi:tetratricopeptide (TPR) repeat protein
MTKKRASHRRRSRSARSTSARLSPAQLSGLLDQGRRLLISGEHERAISILERALPHLPRNRQRAEALSDLGMAYGLLKRDEESYRALLEATQITPDDVRIWYNFGQTCRGAGRLVQSLRAYERSAALNRDPRLASRIAKEVALARQLVETELSVRPPCFTVDNLLAQEDLFLAGVEEMVGRQWDRAADLFRQALALADTIPQLWGNLGICLLNLEQYDEAEAALRRALECDPDYDLARQNLAALAETRRSGGRPTVALRDPLDSRPVPQIFYPGTDNADAGHGRPGSGRQHPMDEHDD